MGKQVKKFDGSHWKSEGYVYRTFALAESRSVLRTRSGKLSGCRRKSRRNFFPCVAVAVWMPWDRRRSMELIDVKLRGVPPLIGYCLKVKCTSYRQQYVCNLLSAHPRAPQLSARPSRNPPHVQYVAFDHILANPPEVAQTRPFWPRDPSHFNVFYPPELDHVLLQSPKTGFVLPCQ